MDEQFQDPILGEVYNLIAIDGLTSGRTQCPSYVDSGKAALHDSWVDAALVALFCQAFDLPPVHLFAVQMIATCTAMRFAAVFRERCLSMSICSVAGPTE